MSNQSDMTPRQALALAVMACEHVSEQNRDVSDWQRAAAVIRGWLAETRGPVEPWTWYGGKTRGRRSNYEQ
jgi:hypothetical protein